MKAVLYTLATLCLSPMMNACAAAEQAAPQSGTKEYYKQETQRVRQEGKAELAKWQGRLDEVTAVRVNAYALSHKDGQWRRGSRTLSPEDTAALVDILRRVRFNDAYNPFIRVHRRIPDKYVSREVVLLDGKGERIRILGERAIVAPSKDRADGVQQYHLDEADYEAYRKLTQPPAWEGLEPEKRKR